MKQLLPEDTISIVPETRSLDIVENARAKKGKKFQPGLSYQGLVVQGTDGLWDGIGSAEDLVRVLNKSGGAIKKVQGYMDVATREGRFDPDEEVGRSFHCRVGVFIMCTI